jgi:very-short-patch-repair endonuclease
MARQHGVISVHQLDECGVTRRQVKTLEANDVLRLVLRGVYRTPSVELTEAGRCAAVSLGRPAAVIAGPTAGRLWGFRKLPGDRRIHVIVPPAANPSIETWVCAFRTSTITADDSIRRADGIRLASRERAAVDLARFVRGDDLLSIIDQAMHDGRLGLDDMYAVATRWDPNRRPWLMQYLRQLSRVLSGGPSESHAEVRVGVALRQRGVRGLVRQHEVLYGSRTIRFDLAVPEIRWALEVDVFPTHNETIGWLADERRDLVAESHGWVVFRIDRDAYENHFTAAIERARQSYLDVSRRQPSPPHR